MRNVIAVLLAVVLVLMIAGFIEITLTLLRRGKPTVEQRIERIESIVGTEPPASMTWTNGHIYSTIVKHSHNCGCVKK